MNRQEIWALLEAGRPVVLGELRRSKAEAISWRDKETGRALTAPGIRHTVEGADETFEVSENFDRPESGDWTKESAEAVCASYVPPFQKGQRVLVEVRSWVAAKGVVKCRGTLHAVEVKG